MRCINGVTRCIKDVMTGITGVMGCTKGVNKSF
jgi:hypothetical protein